MPHKLTQADSTKRPGLGNDKTTLNQFVHSSRGTSIEGLILARQMMRVAAGLHANELPGCRSLSIVQLSRPHPVVGQPLIH